MKKTLLLLNVSTMVVLLLVVTATAQAHTKDGKNSSGPATTAATSTTQLSQTGTQTKFQYLTQTGTQTKFKRLKKTGGISLAGPLALASLGVVIGSGIAMRLVLRRYTSS